MFRDRANITPTRAHGLHDTLPKWEEYRGQQWISHQV